MKLAMAVLTLGFALQARADAPRRYEGTVKQFDSKSGKIFLSLTDRSTGNWTLAPHARVMGATHQPAGRAAVRPGAQVQVQVATDGTVQELWVMEANWGRPFEGGRLRRWDGRVVARHNAAPIGFEVERFDGHGKAQFKTDEHTRFLHAPVNSKAEQGSADLVRDGATVHVLVTPANKKVTEVFVVD
jgi:hypothetical protein